MGQDLGTRLDWVAVDHHNTGHPHSHIVVRGVTEDGKILNIAGDYIAQGIRARASEVVTLELGPQTEQEVQQKLRWRWTRTASPGDEKYLIVDGIDGHAHYLEIADPKAASARM